MWRYCLTRKKRALNHITSINVAHINFSFCPFVHKDLEGTVCSITTLNAREKDSQGPWKIAVAYRTNSEKTFATKLLEFEVTMDFLNGRLQKLPQLCFVYFFVFYT